MAEKQSGGATRLLIGVQTAEGARVPSIQNADGSKGRLIPIRFPMTALSFGEQSESTESNTIIGGRRAVPSQLGQLWASGNYDFEVLPGTIRHLIRLVMNTDPLPTGTDIPAVELLAAKGSAHTSSNDIAHTADDAVGRLATPSRVAFAGTAAGVVRITGKRRIGKPQEEQFDYTETLTLTSSKRASDNYFSTISNITFVSGAISTENGVAVSADPNTKRYAYTFNSQGIIAPMTLQTTKGDVPEFAYDVKIDSFSLSIGDIVTASIVMTGKESTLFAHIPDVTVTDPAALTDATRPPLVTGATKLPDGYLDDFPEPEITFFQRWGGEFIFGGNAVPFTGFDMEVNNNPDTGDPEITGSRFRTAPVYGSRDTTLSPTVLFTNAENDAGNYDAQRNWQYLFRSNTRHAAQLTIFNFLSNGRRERIVVQAPAAQLNTSPVVEIAGDASIPVSLAFDCAGAAGASELTVTVDAIAA